MRSTVSNPRYLPRIAVASVATVLLVASFGCSTAANVAATAAGVAASNADSSSDGGARSDSPGADAPSAGNAPEELQCDSVYSPRNPDSPFTLMYCDPQGINEDTLAEGRGTIRRAMKTAAPNSEERWRAAYVHLCSRELEERRKIYVNMTLTCKWHAEKFSFDELVQKESWMSEDLQNHIRSQLESDQKNIEQTVQTTFPKNENEREWEVYYQLREKVWQEFMADRNEYADYYKVVDEFRRGAANGEVEGCVKPLQSKLAEYVNNPDEKDRQTILERFGDSVGYALTESLARCHWYHDRNFETGAYLKLLDEKRRKVNFGERLYYAQLAELQKDAEKKEKMPHLEGKKLLEMEPDDLTRPSHFNRSEAAEKWRQDGYDHSRDIRLKKRTISRVSQRGEGAVLHFPERDRKQAVKECEKTNRIDYITHSGDVVYERTCRVVDHKTVTYQTDPLELNGDYGLRGGDWVKLFRHTSSDTRGLLIGARGGNPGSRVVRVLDIQIE
jgi:hypothetical protein